MALPVLKRGLHDPVKALRPIVATFSDKPHASAIAFNAKAVAIILYFVEPLAPREPTSPLSAGKIQIAWAEAMFDFGTRQGVCH